MGESSRIDLKVCLVVVVAVVCGLALVKAATPAPEPTAIVRAAVVDDAGDGLATTTFDGPMVRKRVAVALHVVDGADRKLVGRQLREAAKAERIGDLSDATFAVFSEQLLTYLVPEMAVVLPEGATTADAEALMRDHTYTGVSFHLIENVLVHHLTFAVVPSGVTPDEVRAREDTEGILSDSLNHYQTEVQRAGVTVRYFGPIISDGQIAAVRESMARAANVTPDRVAVTASEAGDGVDLSNGAPDLSASSGRTEHHG
jgi:hypothetical protein